VFERVFGPDGLLRRSESTAILSTHSGEWIRNQGASAKYLTSIAVQHLPAADNIIVLDQNGAIIEQGSFDKLKNAGGYVQKLDVTAGTSRSSCGAGERDSEPELTKMLTATAGGTDDLEQKMDRSIWVYYARALGWFRIAAFVVLLAIKAGFECFRCQSQSALQLLVCLDPYWN
jgi:ATP-binding cassette, subfamily C (CFTR/MRP), member 1